MFNRLMVFVIVGLLLVGTAFYLWQGSRTEMCKICSRPLHERMRYIVEVGGNEEVVTCCPRCGLRYQQLDPASVRSVWAVDYVSGERIAGDTTVYVEGSDVHLCCSMTPLREIEGNRYDLTWDRCLPSLVAFGKRDEAEDFGTVHGGKVVTYEDLLEEIRGEIRDER